MCSCRTWHIAVERHTLVDKPAYGLQHLQDLREHLKAVGLFATHAGIGMKPLHRIKCRHHYYRRNTALLLQWRYKPVLLQLICRGCFLVG